MSVGGLFRLPIRSADIWGLNDAGEERDKEDIAADLDYQDNAIEQFLTDATSSSNVATFGDSLARGREPVTMPGALTYSSTITYGHTFSAVPRVNLTIECGRVQALDPILTLVGTASATYTVVAPATSTTTAFVHWVAVAP
jgi:hypothetical protein